MRLPSFFILLFGLLHNSGYTQVYISDKFDYNKPLFGLYGDLMYELTPEISDYVFTNNRLLKIFDPKKIKEFKIKEINLFESGYGDERNLRTYQFNKDGNLVKISHKKDVLLQLKYDNSGRLKKMISNGYPETIITKFKFDKNNILIEKDGQKLIYSKYGIKEYANYKFGYDSLTGNLIYGEKTEYDDFGENLINTRENYLYKKDSQLIWIHRFVDERPEYTRSVDFSNSNQLNLKTYNASMQLISFINYNLNDSGYVLKGEYFKKKEKPDSNLINYIPPYYYYESDSTFILYYEQKYDYSQKNRSVEYFKLQIPRRNNIFFNNDEFIFDDNGLLTEWYSYNPNSLDKDRVKRRFEYTYFRRN